MKKVLIFLFCIFLCFSVSRVSATEKVEINTASLEQLDEIIGIGPALGQRIIDARPFSSVDDLLKVQGIGEKTLQKIKDQGLAYVSGNPNDQISNPNQIQNPNDQKTDTAPTPIPAPTPSPAPAPAITYPSNIFLNELLPSPEGADETEEWIEIFDKNNFEADVSGWKIKDIAGKITTYIFPDGTKIPGQGYLLLRRPETKITLNNDGDGLILLRPDGATADSVDFGKAPLGRSYSKSEAGWTWSATLTPSAPNTFPLPEGKTENHPPPNQNEKAGDGPLSAYDDNFQTAAMGEKIPISQNRSFPFLIAIVLSVTSAGLIFILKRFLACRET